MIRPILTELLLFVAPFAIYALFLMATRNGVIDASAWNLRVLGILTIIALLLLFGSFFLLAHWTGHPAGSKYVPPHMEDGRLVPGQFK
ncbi:DUF6111 family protein [Pseudorhodoplanes sinuspersici]|uniref:Uncharacterized protein n=1 Tax=Pseudorhodoplanes sinuspersici TaxID=1235591 RepID=A0A1W6ZK67_9HYPH|nr:DUF6111 family protein [Pseudorhodoplanes sinuspersici]ARP97741.1 hypothetical protein CAK95_00600 [Pseudorhodoplanes sinuspersici]RKE68535.1 hypothetical protein DFP91_4926 [Pseudorhodoplanes sinuspersici]